MRIALANLLIRANRRKPAFDVEEELQYHIEMLEHKYAQQGMSAADAKAAALKRFGDPERVKLQCVHISSRKSLPRRVLRTSLILVALTGLAIHLLSSDPRIAHIGDTLVMIAISGRLLLYVRGLAPSTFLSNHKVRSQTPKNGSGLYEA